MNKLRLSIICLLITTSTHAKFIKVSSHGKILADTSQNWSCVVDDKSGLVWEVKKQVKGLNNTESTYTWFDGKIGTKHGEYSHNCHWEQNCNTDAFINAMNDIALCRVRNWRLPTTDELKTLLVYGDIEPLIDTRFFPNTQKKSYWTSETDRINPEIAVDVPFFYGGTTGTDKYFDGYVRAVSNAR